MTIKTIVTHSGTFHADESLAVFLLRQTKDFAGSRLIRTRDPAVIAQADVVVDVGGEYIPEKLRFDHHQRGFTETFDSKHDIKLSSAGLVYKHFGKQVMAKVLEWPETDSRLDLLYTKIYDDLIEGFDGNDNGVSRYPTEIKAKYKDGTGIASRVARLNPWWNQDGVNLDERFEEAVKITGQEFLDKVLYIGKAWLPARDIVLKGLSERFEIHKSGHLILFNQFCPWKEHLHLLETETNVKEDQLPLYIIYPDESKKWRVQAVPKSPESFESRKALPEVWRGVRDEELSKLSGIPGCIFVHASGFIGGTQTKEGALAMAIKALDM
ncbi:hypothetical protein HDV05_000922 [Chytridiales sp. JEL 0842]|nr:hypothetical protein HDV05_000922 [Chytridiales sp. JEL 0842]